MPTRTEKKTALNEMSVEELEELEDGCITIMNYMNVRLTDINKEKGERLKKNLIK
jgi:hypothetical protein